MFLLGAAAAGVLAGRLTSGIKAAHSDDQSSGGQGMRPIGANYVDAAPSYAEYSETVMEVPSPVTPPRAAPLPPPPYGTVPPAGSIVPPASPAGWDDPARRPGGVG
jgi:hypothetical protein